MLIFLAIVGIVFYAVGNLSRDSEAQRLEAVEQAVVRASVQCYAIEGRYPSGVRYLSEHYGLALQENRYIYHYERIADNIMPKIQVLSIN